MLTLFVKTGCPFCGKVLETGREQGIAFVIKNVATPGVIEELVTKGGKRQVPFLIDEACGVSIYESDAIIAHLLEKHAPRAQ